MVVLVVRQLQSCVSARNTFGMIKQAKISSFLLKSPQQKRPNDVGNENGTPDKKPKLSNVKTPEKESSSEHGKDSVSPLTPEQKCRIAQNQLMARMKVVSKKTDGLVVNMGLSWFKALEAEFSKPYFVKLAKFVQTERQTHTVYPPESQVWTWTQMCDIKDVKVVILGQDPYHGPNQAHGLCFSVQKGVNPPPSLVNMYKELETDIPGFVHPKHGNLTGWSKQGVLLLNAVLTVRAHQANSHKDQGWEMLTDAVISWLNKNREGLVFMLWGSYAQKKGACINKTKHHILKSVHPSPLSAHRGFFGCKHFSESNKLLEKKGKKPIDWSYLPSSYD
ncbi:hypothetical protein LSH36_36g08032 [Paralvinella palmiformis]|uniref:Uracil-DNA glycosylase n=1 Tax=Paralvinella palmiformis TaxID=53620 RepID=A0AAD9K8P9_9ANNE|nr:hypothetical protein LSH36_36g08032 [Paralvinella palmiformis]